MAKNIFMSGINVVFGWLWNILGGKIITVNFLRRHFAKIAVVLFVVFGFIANRFSGILEMRRIDNLEGDLKSMQSEYILSSADYFSKIRERTMKQLVDTLQLDLDVPQQPPYILKDDDE